MRTTPIINMFDVKEFLWNLVFSKDKTFVLNKLDIDERLKEALKLNSELEKKSNEYINSIIEFSVEMINKEDTYYDIEVGKTHNYIAEGISTHNSTYGLNRTRLSDFPLHKDAIAGKDKIGIKSVWFSFNDIYAWNKFSDELPKSIEILEVQ